MPVKSEWGHGIYNFHTPAASFDGCYFGLNGWQPGKADDEKNPKRHGIYHGDPAGTLRVTNSILDRNAACGVQHRGTGDALISGCIFVCNGTGVLTKQKLGTTTIDGCLFLGTDWTLQVDQNGVTAYAPTKITNCTFVGLKRAVAADGRKRNPPSWLAIAKRQKLDPAGKPVLDDKGNPVLENVPVDSATGNRVVQWAGPGIDYDPTPILADVAAGTVNVADAIGKIRGDVAKLAP